MTITRNINGENIEIVLYESELCQAASEYQAECRMEDIRRVINGEEYGHPNDDELAQISLRAEKIIGNNSNFWDAYWACIDYAIEEVLK